MKNKILDKIYWLLLNLWDGKFGRRYRLLDNYAVEINPLKIWRWFLSLLSLLLVMFVIIWVVINIIQPITNFINHVVWGI